MVVFHISDSARSFESEIRYTLALWSVNQSTAIRFSENRDGAVSIGSGEGHTLHIAKSFTGPDAAARKSPFVLTDGTAGDQLSASVDLLASAFQMANALQEYGATELDELNRYQYASSYQHRLNIAGKNLVQDCFNAISTTLQLPVNTFPTRFFLSHDIDLVYSAILEDGYYVLRRGRIDLFLKMLFRVAVGRPDWLNMDQIMTLESVHDCKSIFFWIVNKGRLNAREENADYPFRSTKIQKQFGAVAEHGFENGLHKSLNKESFRDEFTKYGSVPYANRYHYLKFGVPQAWHDLEAAGLKLDASLGFSAEMGFRNSYGLPLNPYNFETKRPFSFVEAPLHIMDRTFFQYKKQLPRHAGESIINFFESNRTNCVLSVLWHNNFFTDYKFKGYLALYKQILAYLSDNRFRTISAKEITEHFTITV